MRQVCNTSLVHVGATINTLVPLLSESLRTNRGRRVSDTLKNSGIHATVIRTQRRDPQWSQKVGDLYVCGSNLHSTLICHAVGLVKRHRTTGNTAQTLNRRSSSSFTGRVLARDGSAPGHGASTFAWQCLCTANMHTCIRFVCEYPRRFLTGMSQACCATGSKPDNYEDTAVVKVQDARRTHIALIALLAESPHKLLAESTEGWLPKKPAATARMGAGQPRASAKPNQDRACAECAVNVGARHSLYVQQHRGWLQLQTWHKTCRRGGK